MEEIRVKQEAVKNEDGSSPHHNVEVSDLEAKEPDNMVVDNEIGVLCESYDLNGSESYDLNGRSESYDLNGRSESANDDSLQEDKYSQYIVVTGPGVGNRIDNSDERNDVLYETEHFSNLNNSQEHDATDDQELVSGVFSCEHCNETFKTKSVLQKHIKATHSGVKCEDLTCEDCDKSYKTQSALNKHMKSKHGGDTEKTSKDLSCYNCEVKFKSKKRLRIHQEECLEETEDEAGGFACMFCDVSCDSEDALVCHLAAHHDNIGGGELRTVIKTERFDCEECSESYDKQSSLTRHITRMHPRQELRENGAGSEGFPCNICKEVFATKIRMRSHKRKHLTSSHACEECGKCFSLLGQLNRHVKTHLAVKPHKCEHCERRFSELTAMKKHAVTHERKAERRSQILNVNGDILIDLDKSRVVERDKSIAYRCGVCGRSFPHRSTLERHANMHSPERPYLCQECGKSFSSIGSLSIHVKIHSEVKPYCCSQCDKTFLRPFSLKSHMLVHEEGRPKTYLCPECGKAYLNRGGLIQHLKLHSGEKAFACPICQRSFSRNYSLQSHLKHRHKIRDPTASDLTALTPEIADSSSPVPKARKTKPKPRKKTMYACEIKETLRVCETCYRCFDDRTSYVYHMRRCGIMHKTEFPKQRRKKGFGVKTKKKLKNARFVTVSKTGLNGIIDSTMQDETNRLVDNTAFAKVLNSEFPASNIFSNSLLTDRSVDNSAVERVLESSVYPTPLDMHVNIYIDDGGDDNNDDSFDDSYQNSEMLTEQQFYNGANHISNNKNNIGNIKNNIGNNINDNVYIQRNTVNNKNNIINSESFPSPTITRITPVRYTSSPIVPQFAFQQITASPASIRVINDLGDDNQTKAVPSTYYENVGSSCNRLEVIEDLPYITNNKNPVKSQKNAFVPSRVVFPVNSVENRAGSSGISVVDGVKSIDKLQHSTENHQDLNNSQLGEQTEHNSNLSKNHTKNQKKQTNRKNTLVTKSINEAASTQKKKHQCFACEPEEEVCFDTAEMLMSHVKTDHWARDESTGKCVMCKQCGRSFKSQRNLILHDANKHNIKPKGVSVSKTAVCELCGATFSKKSNLNKHIKNLHTERTEEEKQAETSRFTCDICGKGFSRGHRLRDHRMIHSNVRPFACQYCGRRFRVKNVLTTHIYTHTGEKPYPCKLCDKHFREASSLRKHQSVHTGERPFKCDVCDLTFSHRSNLTSHKKTHTGERNFVCKLCGERFARSNTLNTHMKRHS